MKAGLRRRTSKGTGLPMPASTSRSKRPKRSAAPPKPTKRPGPRPRARRSASWTRRLPVLEQRHFDLLGLGLFALAAFMAFALYLRWDGGAGGAALVDGLRWAFGQVAYAVPRALVAAGGVLVSMFLTFNANIGVVFTMKALIVVIMGGVGNVTGALVAGFVLGLVETTVATVIDPGLTLAATFAIFLIVLLWRPQGIFGRD